ncbi:GIN domain-containing protein [Pedobacter sp. GSP4]|uniref:GIN domain-containing protein n=1 Tax=Pedobacter sp. GSP4 TaxID=3453716 RepID=UPI003EEFF37C
MKISIRLLSLSIMLVAMLFMGGSVSAYSFPDRFLETTEVDFNRIKVSGNVELIIIPSFRSGIAYQECSFGTAKVMQDGMNLSIKSISRETAKMVVFVKDIFRVIASGNALVETEGKLRTQYLQLILKDRAWAKVNSFTEGLYTLIEGGAKLRMSGTTIDHTQVITGNEHVVKDEFVAVNTYNITKEGAEERTGK